MNTTNYLRTSVTSAINETETNLTTTNSPTIMQTNIQTNPPITICYKGHTFDIDPSIYHYYNGGAKIGPCNNDLWWILYAFVIVVALLIVGRLASRSK
jgi:hypothetical protein